MRDYQHVIVKFVKIVEKHPEVYNSTLESYRTRQTDLAWETIAEAVRTELEEECTVEEIKAKWKGIRSSFNRYKNKILFHGEPKKKKYYLYDSLRFLDPYVKPKGSLPNRKNRNFEESDTLSDDDKSQDDFEPEFENYEIKIKSELSDRDIFNTNESLSIEFDPMNTSSINQQVSDIIMESSTHDDSKTRKRKCEDSCSESDCEDLQFFKSILPDIKKFTAKEKRKLKMGILNLIDEIDDARKQSDSSQAVTTSISKSGD